MTLDDAHLKFGNGPWKEGRAMAASLCYVDLTPAQLTSLVARHARVGIRATLVCSSICGGLASVVERNWDLATPDTALPAMTVQLNTLDGRSVRGSVALTARSASQMVASAYRVVTGPGTIAVHGAHLGEDLPSYAAPKDQTILRSEIEASSAAGNWSIWRIDSQVLAAMGDANHASLLDWLGQNHARVWCAPVHDVQQYRMKRKKS